MTTIQEKGMQAVSGRMKGFVAQMPPARVAEYRRQMTAFAPEMKRIILKAVQSQVSADNRPAAQPTKGK